MVNLFALATDPAVWAALVTLIVMEVVLGIDNLIFISVLTNKLPRDQRARGQRIGIFLALVLRLALLGTVAWVARLTEPAFSIFEHDFSWRDLVLATGGLFLVWKATTEIRHHVAPPAKEESSDDPSASRQKVLSFGSAIGQIIMLDIVFSIDSIITAVGMTEHLPIMIIAVIVAVCAMMFAAQPLSRFIEQHPTIVMLALSFLLVIGMTLIAEGFGTHVPKGYVYAAMAFSALVEGLNMLAQRARRAGRSID